MPTPSCRAKLLKIFTDYPEGTELNFTWQIMQDIYKKYGATNLKNSCLVRNTSHYYRKALASLITDKFVTKTRDGGIAEDLICKDGFFKLDFTKFKDFEKELKTATSSKPRQARKKKSKSLIAAVKSAGSDWVKPLEYQWQTSNGNDYAGHQNYAYQSTPSSQVNALAPIQQNLTAPAYFSPIVQPNFTPPPPYNTPLRPSNFQPQNPNFYLGNLPGNNFQPKTYQPLQIQEPAAPIPQPHPKLALQVDNPPVSSEHEIPAPKLYTKINSQTIDDENKENDKPRTPTKSTINDRDQIATKNPDYSSESELVTDSEPEFDEYVLMTEEYWKGLTRQEQQEKMDEIKKRCKCDTNNLIIFPSGIWGNLTGNLGLFLERAIEKCTCKSVADCEKCKNCRAPRKIVEKPAPKPNPNYSLFCIDLSHIFF